MTENKRFKSRCYEKQKNTVIYDDGEKLFDVSTDIIRISVKWKD